MLPSELQQLVQHMEWADALVWNFVLARPEAQSDTRLRELLHHKHSVQWAYLQIWREDSLDIPEVSTFPDLPTICGWCQKYYEQVGPFLEALDPESLEREVDFPWAHDLMERGGTARPATLAETILQISSHTTYHRGQVNKRLRELEGEPPLTDFVAWIWMDRPAPDWRSLNTT